MTFSVKRLFDLEGAADYLSMSPRTFEELVSRGEIPLKRIPEVRRNFYDIRDLDQWADNSLITIRQEKKSLADELEKKIRRRK